MVLPYWPPQTPGTLPMVLPDWPLETLQNPALAGLWALGSVRWPLEMLQNLALARLWALGFRGSRICTRNDERKVFFLGIQRERLAGKVQPLKPLKPLKPLQPLEPCQWFCHTGRLKPLEPYQWFCQTGR